uniref:Sulfotransferase domain-containing protein n=1 Tax=Glossina brevipalpis TaxID=37001 RepID=A0A1A9WJW3_9MUSC
MNNHRNGLPRLATLWSDSNNCRLYWWRIVLNDEQCSRLASETCSIRTLRRENYSRELSKTSRSYMRINIVQLQKNSNNPLKVNPSVVVLIMFSNYRSQRVSGLNRKMTIRWCKELKYMQPELPVDTTASEYNTAYQTEQGTQMGLTALASFPGSGNTWLRYLLQQSTGILTGSIYKDYGLLKTGFPAENVCNNSVLLVKTHEWGPKAWALFSKAILLVRDPEKAILAEFNRQSGGHVGFASPDHLVNRLEPVLRNILEFLEFPINEVRMKTVFHSQV